MKLKLGQVADWIHAEGEFVSTDEVAGYSIDSRTVGAGELFFAVMGERFDGHEFVQTALEAGAVAAVVSMRWVVPAEVDPCKLLRVPDGEDCVLSALQKLAREVRKSWGGRVIGITGSAGKTTTKECVATVLAAKFKVLKSAGNLNNHFGVPLQLLRLEKEHQVAVIEMGMNHAGEIAALAKIAEPDWAVVSNVAAVHLEFFADGIEGIARAKKELVDALPVAGVAFLNADDVFVSTFGEGHEARMFGLSEAADVRGVDVKNVGLEGMQFVVQVAAREGRVAERMRARIALLGEHNVYNALAAIAVGLESGMTLGECVFALDSVVPSDKRGEMIEWRGARLINDSYNSNPRALEAMVDALMAIEGGRHIVIAGEMLELGQDAGKLHAASGRQMAKRGVDVVVGVRGFAESLAGVAKMSGAEALFVKTPEEAGAWMKTNLREGDVVLLKASRGVRLEKALASLAEGAVDGEVG